MFAPLQQNRSVVQRKLEIGQPNDKYEQEADQVADQVVSGSNAPAVQMRSTGKYNLQMVPLPSNPMLQMQGEMEEKEEEKIQMDQEEEEEQVQMKCKECEEEEKIQKKPAVQMSSEGTGHASPELANQLNNNNGKGQSLSSDIQQDIGGKMGVDLSGVKIHTGKEAIQMNQDLGAKAFTNGQNIYFNEGQYNPHSQEGKHLLAHELTHTVQQGASSPDIQMQEEDDRSVLNKPTPWSGVINSKGHSTVGFHKESKEAESKEDYIWPAFKHGDSVQVINVGKDNWLKVSVEREGKTVTGFVDWRYVEEPAEVEEAEPEVNQEEEIVTVNPTGSTKIQIGKSSVYVCGEGEDYLFADRLHEPEIQDEFVKRQVAPVRHLPSEAAESNLRATMWLAAGDIGSHLVDVFAEGKHQTRTHSEDGSVAADVKESSQYSKEIKRLEKEVNRQINEMISSTGVINLYDLDVEPNLLNFADSTWKLEAVFGPTQGAILHINNFKLLSGNTYSYQLEFTMCDDYGLEMSDIAEWRLAIPELVQMWVLQHERTGYAPFIHELTVKHKVNGKY